MSSKAHYLLGSLIDYKRLVLFPRNMPVKRTEYTFRCGHRRWTENTERGSENSLSLSSNQEETLSPHLCLPIFSFIFCFPSSFCFLLSDRPSFFLILSTKISPYTYICSPVFHAIPSFSLSRARISSRLPILFESSARNPSVVLLIMPAESSPVPISSCLQGQLISSTRYYEYSRFSFFLVHLSLAASTLFPLVVVILVVVVLIVVSLSGQPFPVILAARWRRFKAY